MKNYLIGAFAIVTIVFGYFAFNPNQKNPLGGRRVWSERVALTVDADPYMNHSMASTTQTNLVYVGTASSTYSDLFVDESDQANFRFFGAAATTTQLTPFATTGEVPTSNSPLNLNYCVYGSHNKTNYFAIKAFQSGASNCDTWSPGTIASSTIDIPITNLNSRYLKIEFASNNSTSTRFGLWSEYILKKGN